MSENTMQDIFVCAFVRKEIDNNFDPKEFESFSFWEDIQTTSNDNENNLAFICKSTNDMDKLQKFFSDFPYKIQWIKI